jgi:predicted Zn-dependent protease with MMP-like domain
MLLMLFLVLGLIQDVINEHHNKLVQILHKDLVHEVGRCIG